jgi:hypothetical protein
MSDAEIRDLQERIARGDEDAVAPLLEIANEREDAYDLRLLAESGSTDGLDEAVQVATESGDVDELRRLEADGNPDATEVLDDLYDEDPTDDGT